MVDFLHLEWLDMMNNCTAIANSQDGQFGRFNTQNTQVSVVSLDIGGERKWKERHDSGGRVFLPDWTGKGRE